MTTKKTLDLVCALTEKDILGRTDFGTKVKHVVVLRSQGINVPDGFAISQEVYNEFVAPHMAKIEKIIGTYSRNEAAHYIRKMFLSLTINKSVQDAISEEIKRCNPAGFYAVRSSGIACSSNAMVNEDSTTTALAGQYETCLMVPASQVLMAVRHCWASLFNERSLAAFDPVRNKSYLQRSTMSVLVQRMIHGEASAVAMTIDPCETEELIGIEATYGPCEALVSGVVTGDLYHVDRASRLLKRMTLGTKRIKLEYEPFQGIKPSNLQRIPTSTTERGTFALSAAVIEQIAHIAMEIESIFNAPQDIEVAVLENRLYILQARSITAFCT